MIKFLIRHKTEVNFVLAMTGLIVMTVFGVLTLPPAPAHLTIDARMDVDLMAVWRAFNVPLKVVWEDRIGLEEPRKTIVEKAQLVVLSLKNTGGQVFDWNDKIGGPIQFSLKSDSKFLNVQKGGLFGPSTIPSSLEIPLGWKSFTLLVPFLNPGEETEMVVIHTGSEDDLAVLGRAKGQPTLAINRSRYKLPFLKSPVVTSIIANCYVISILALVTLSIWRFTVLGEKAGRAAYYSIVPAVCGPFFVGTLFVLIAWCFPETERSPESFIGPLYICGLFMIGWLIKKTMRDGVAFFLTAVTGVSEMRRVINDPSRLKITYEHPRIRTVVDDPVTDGHPTDWQTGDERTPD